MHVKLVSLALLAVLTGAAQETRLSGPVSGFLFDRGARALRPILGVPGAAHLGEAIATEVDMASVSPDGRLALLSREGRLYLLREPGQGSPVEIDGALADADRIAWNTASTAAAIWGRTGRMQLFEVASSRLADIAAPSGRVLSLAVDEAGERVVAGFEDDGVYVLGAGAEARLLTRTARPVALALARGGSDLYVADAAAREVLVIGDFASSSAAQLVAAEGRGISDPVGLAVSRDRSALLIVSREGRSLSVLRLSSGEIQNQIALDFEPTGLDSLSDTLLWMNPGAGEGQPLLVTEPAVNPGVWFVPARKDQ